MFEFDLSSSNGDWRSTFCRIDHQQRLIYNSEKFLYHLCSTNGGHGTLQRSTFCCTQESLGRFGDPGPVIAAAVVRVLVVVPIVAFVVDVVFLIVVVVVVVLLLFLL